MIAAGRGDLPIALYVIFVVVGLAIGATLLVLLVAALVSIIRQPALGSAEKIGWVLLCLVLPLAGPQAWFIWSRRAYGRTRRLAPDR